MHDATAAQRQTPIRRFVERTRARNIPRRGRSVRGAGSAGSGVDAGLGPARRLKQRLVLAVEIAFSAGELLVSFGQLAGGGGGSTSSAVAAWSTRTSTFSPGSPPGSGRPPDHARADGEDPGRVLGPVEQHARPQPDERDVARQQPNSPSSPGA